MLSQYGIAYADHDVDRRPVGSVEAMQIAKPFPTLYVKMGGEILRWDQREAAIPEADLKRAFVHEDGQLRIPVLIVGDVIVRGFDELTYARLLAGRRTP